jgi:SagB-type dehydrogenase family enzyme
MNRRNFLYTTTAAGVVAAAFPAACAPPPVAFERIMLPAPQISGGKALMQCLSERHSAREFGSEPLTLQVIANVLWAGFGVNRVEDTMRTAPSGHNVQEIDLYVVLPEGMYVYNAVENSLDPVVEGDHRAAAGADFQEYVATAGMNLVYVADISKFEEEEREEQRANPVNSLVGTGCIVQNVYLVCAAEGLNTVVRAGINKEAFSALAGLRDDQMITVMQCVGNPPPVA